MLRQASTSKVSGSTGSWFQSPLWGLDECFLVRHPSAQLPRRPVFQSPLWGLDECFPVDQIAADLPAQAVVVSVPFMGIG